MFRLIKRWLYGFCASALLCGMLSFSVRVRAEEEPLPLCAEEELLLLKTVSMGDSSSTYRVYDWQGTFQGEVKSLQWAPCATVDRNHIETAGGDGFTTVYLLSEGMKNFRIDEKNGYVSELGGRIFCSRPETGAAVLFDRDGKELFSLPGGVPEDGKYYDIRGEICGEDFLIGRKVWNMDEGYEDSAETRQENPGEEQQVMLLVGQDGKVIRRITNPELTAAFFDGRFHAMKDQWIVWKKGRYIFYDFEEEITATVPVPEDVYGIEEHDGFVANLRYPQLEDRICAGFLVYNNYSCAKVVPYAYEDGGILIYMDGAARHLSLAEGETAEAVNKDVAVTCIRRDGEEICRRVLRLQDSSELCRYDDGQIAGMELGDGYCILKEEKEEYQYRFHVTDYEGNELLTFENGRVSGWENGYLCLSHSIYNGIIDRNGNWVLRVIYGEE